MSDRTIQLSGFPHTMSAEEVTQFLEKITGEAGIVVREVRPMNTEPRSRLCAVVQFTSAKFAEDVSSKAQQRLLWYKDSYLTVKPNQQSTMFQLEHAVLHVGCQVSDDRFFVLWSVEDVAVSFGFELRKLQFFLHYHGFEYKLDLFYGDIRQIQLHHHHDQDNKFILIQLKSAPRIYKKVDTPNNEWVRETDFTPHHCIGQSPALCLEIPHACELPYIRENFIYFKENEERFTLVGRDSSFCQRSDLVPIIEPSQDIQLPYYILFKVNNLVQKGIIMRPTLDDEFFRLLNPCSINNHYIDDALEILSNRKEICFEPVRWLCKQYRKYEMLDNLPKSATVPLEPGLVYVHRVQVTPTKVYFCGPEVNESNRVLRHFAEDIENFIRVSFVDEDLEKIRSTDLILRTAAADGERYTNIYNRILSTLRDGIVIGEKKFEFLAFSSSQLRESSAWMFASRSGLTAADIREWMGEFSHIRNVAKYAARLGQSFGSSKETLTVMKNEIEHLPDILTEDLKYDFSDGIGKISADFAAAVASTCNLSWTPSAFQIRYAGYKGVVAVDPNSKFKLSLRNSMCKYKSQNTKLDVLLWSKRQPFFLNRELITLLSTRGVKDHAFEMKQSEVVTQLDMILTDPVRAQEVLEVMAPGENSRVLRRMLQCGYNPQEEPFLSMMLQTFRASKLWELRTKTRIFVPDARLMMGCLDETGTLEYGQVFVNISCVKRTQFCKNEAVLVGEVVVGRNPCLHPGDVRVLMAVDVPALHHMVDCVVFPQKGKRPHPNECSGGDLDGDLYFVCWDKTLIPRRHIRPMEYTPAPPAILDHDVRIEEVEEYFANYMVNDSLGLIASAHIAIADREPRMAESDSCKELARLHSIAVDFPKTGVPAKFPHHLRVKKFPDFMEKPNRPAYESRRVLGKLFRAIKNIAQPTGHITAFTHEVAVKSYDPDMEVNGFKDYIADAVRYKGMYDLKLANLMDHYGIETEAEIVSGNIMKMSSSFTKRKDADTIGLAMKTLKREARAWFDEKAGSTDPGIDDDVYAKVSAWYHVTYHPDYWGRYNAGMNQPHFISFPWCLYEKLVDIKEKAARMREAGAEAAEVVSPRLAEVSRKEALACNPTPPEGALGVGKASMEQVPDQAPVEILAKILKAQPKKMEAEIQAGSATDPAAGEVSSGGASLASSKEIPVPGVEKPMFLGPVSASPTERELSNRFKEWVEAGIFTESLSGTPCPELSKLYPEAKPALRIYGKLFSKLQPRPDGSMRLLHLMKEGAWSGAALVYIDLARATVEGLAQVENEVVGLRARIERYERLGFPMEMARAHLKVLVEGELKRAAYRLNIWVAKKNKANEIATYRDQMAAIRQQTAEKVARAEKRLKELREARAVQGRALHTANAWITQLGTITSELDRACVEFNNLKRDLLG